MFAPKKILVPTDFSKYSDNALKQALDIAQQQKGKIYLLHVIGIIQQCAIDYCLDQATVEELEMKASKAATERMQKQINKVAKSMQVEIIPEIRKGTPAKEILEAQQKNRIDLLVIASHGMTGILSHLGSVAEKVARQAKCPVYIVRSK